MNEETPRSEYPFTYSPASEIPEKQVKMVHDLTSLLLDGEHSTLEVLRTQLAESTVTRLEWTGAGFFADFLIPETLPLSEPGDLTGGSAFLTVEGLPHGAGCVLFVRNGVLDMLEGYTYGDGEWAEDAEIVGIADVEPIVVKLVS